MNSSYQSSSFTKCSPTLSLLLALFFGALSHVGNGAEMSESFVTVAASHFDDTNSPFDGWRGTNSPAYQTNLLGGATSNSVGYIRIGESSGDGQTMYFVAPSKFLGDKRSAYNGFLQLKLRQSETGNFSGHGDFIILASSNIVLSFSLRSVPSTSWQSYQVPINENVGWQNITSNRFANQVDFFEVLRSLQRLWIRAEYSFNGAEHADLDDVELLGQVSGSEEPILGVATYSGITIQAEVGSSYRIEYRPTLDATNWQKLTDVILPTSPFFFIDRSSPSAASRFYQAVLNQ